MKKVKLLYLIFALAIVTAVTLTLCACDHETSPEGDQTQQQTGDTGNTDNGNTDSGQTDGTPSIDNTIAIPEGLSVDNGTVTWNSVKNISKYELELNGNVIARSSRRYVLTDYADLPADGVFSLRIRAVTDNAVGPWSAVVTYTYSGRPVVTPTVSGLTGTVMNWSTVSNAKYPRITIGDRDIDLAADATSYDLSTVSERSDVALTYIADGVYHKNSATLRFVYTPASGKTPAKLAFAAPTNVRMEGEILYFDKVEGANIYHFLDVNNTETTITGEAINDLMNDRKGHNLIRHMWAGNTELAIADSDPTEVTYFTAERGKGTADEPYLINSIGDMRYIEYYESINRSCYYKLAADIVFDNSYHPKDDEDYSNFYNLGSLSGVLDGDGHALENIVVYYKDGYSSIFDNITETGRICNLTIRNTVWRTWTNRAGDGNLYEKGCECAVLTYTNYGEITDVTLTGESRITAIRDGAAGLVSINRGAIRNCRIDSEVTIYGANEAGGFAIYNDGLVRGCINAGAVSGITAIGGIVGRNSGTVTECGNEGSVTGDTLTGGIVGYNYNIKDVDDSMQFTSMVSYCYNRGTVTALSYAGGIVGRNGSTGINELSEMRYANAGVYGCYNQGKVYGLISAGGLVGDNCAYYGGASDDGYGVRACYSSGIVAPIGIDEAGIYLSVAECSWAEKDLPDIYVHYWRRQNDADVPYANWPGAKMQKVQVDGYAFYYLSLGNVNAEDVKGLIFSRVDPTNSSNVFNSTADITATAIGGSLVYAINSDFTNATSACLGILAGYNNQVNDCYYARQGALSAITCSGSATGVSEMNSNSDKQAIADALNNTLGSDAFAVYDNKYPTLTWEQVE